VPAAEIQDLIQREIEAVNANFARVETVKKFFLIERQLTPEDEELTRHEAEAEFREPALRDRDRRDVWRPRGGVSHGKTSEMAKEQ